jgi:hypothetical protein
VLAAVLLLLLLLLLLQVFDVYVKPCGELGETQRDLFHSQFGLG